MMISDVWHGRTCVENDREQHATSVPRIGHFLPSRDRFLQLFHGIGDSAIPEISIVVPRIICRF